MNNNQRTTMGPQWNSSLMNLQKTDKTNRMSTVGFNRSTTIGNLKEKDPRPISDKNFQELSCKKIINYLITHNYENEISYKLLMNLSQKDFFSIFSFLLCKLRQDYSFVLKKIDEDVPKILSDIKYPFNIPKHCLISFGTNTSLAPIYAMFLWIVEILMALEETENEEENSEINNEFEKLEEEYLKACFEEYLRTGEKQHFDLTEKFNQNAIKLKDNIDKKYSETEKELELINRNIEKLKNNSLELEALRKRKENLVNENEEMSDKLQLNERLIVSKNNELTFQEQSLEAKNQKLNDLKKVLDESEKTVNEQIISFEEYEKLKQIVANNDKQSLFLLNKKKELTEIEFNQSNEIDSIYKTINEKKKTIMNINDKIKSHLNVEDTDNVNFFHLEKNYDKYLSMISDFTFDSKKIEEEFSGVFKEVNDKNDVLNKCLVEFEEDFIKLKREILRIEDKITEKKQILMNANNDYESLINSHNNKKEKLCNDYKELSEANQELKNEIDKLIITNDQKKKEHEAFRIRENELININTQKEEEVNKITIVLENDFKETIEEVCKYKSEIYKSLRRASKNMQIVFQNVTSIEQ